jgi:hypothetical protein
MKCLGDNTTGPKQDSNHASPSPLGNLNNVGPEKEERVSGLKKRMIVIFTRGVSSFSPSQGDESDPGPSPFFLSPPPSPANALFSPVPSGACQWHVVDPAAAMQEVNQHAFDA